MFVETEISPSAQRDLRATGASARPARPTSLPRISSPIRPASRATRRPRPTGAPSSAAAAPSPTPPPSIPARKLGGNHGFTLDPVVALRRRVRVPRQQEGSLTFWTVVGAEPRRGRGDDGWLDHPEGFPRQAMLAWTRSQVQTRHMGLSLADAANVQKLASLSDLSRPVPARCRPTRIAAGPRPAVGALADEHFRRLPIFAVRIGDVADLEIVAQALRFQEYMRARGLLADLVIINEQASSYVQDLQQAIESLCENSRLRGKELGPRQHIFAVRRDLMDENSYKTLLAVARVALHTRNGTHLRPDRARGSGGACRRAMRRRHAVEARLPRSQAGRSPRCRRRVCRSAADGSGLRIWNGFGGFDRDGRDYVVQARPASARRRIRGSTSSPTRRSASTRSAEGASFTWSRNSRDFQLTPWSNDPVSNRPGEAIYVFDHASGKAFSPFAAVARDPAMTLRGAARSGLLHLQRQARPAVARTDAACRSRRPGEGVAADHPQFRVGCGAAAGLCLCRMGAWQQSREIRADHRAGARRRRPARFWRATPTASTSATASRFSPATARPSQ